MRRASSGAHAEDAVEFCVGADRAVDTAQDLRWIVTVILPLAMRPMLLAGEIGDPPVVQLRH